MVQNKFHFAIARQTAAEIIYTKVDKDKQNMGLTTLSIFTNQQINSTILTC